MWLPNFEGHVSANGSLKVDQNYEIFSFSGNPFGEDERLWITVADTNSTVSDVLEERAVQLQIGSGASDEIQRQSRQTFPYYAGNESVLKFGYYADLQEGAVFEYGIGNDNDRIVWVIKNDTAAVAFRSSASGTPVDTIFNQEDWNIDTMDGQGESGIHIDWSLGQMLSIRFAWYGWSGILWSVKLGRKLYPVHYHQAGNRTNLPLLGNPSLPIIKHLYNTQATAGTSTVKTHGLHYSVDGSDPVNRPGFSRSTFRQEFSVTSNANPYVILALRPKTVFKTVNNSSLSVLESITIAGSAGGIVVLGYDPTITGATWSDVNTNESYMEQDATQTTADAAAVDAINWYSIAVDAGANGATEISDFPVFKEPWQPDSDFSATHILAILFYCDSNGTIAATMNWTEVHA